MLDVVMCSISGPDAKSHDWAEGEGSFAEAILDLADGARTEVTRSNMRVLVPIADLVRHQGAPCWRLVCIGYDGDPDPRCPRLAMAVPRVLHAAAHAQKNGTTVELEGFPLCLLGPYRSLVVPSGRRHLPERCGSCALAATCPGADAAYLQRYGDAELRPVSSTGAISSQPKRRR